MKVIEMTASGGPEVLRLADRPQPTPGQGQVLVQVAAAGVNFMDIGVRRGGIWAGGDPKVLGVEGAGRIIALGQGVDEFEIGQRVAWVYGVGSYAERLAIPAQVLVPIPDAIDDHTAAAVMMQGLTASHFATDFYRVQSGDTALVHAAAGGLGLLLTQIIKLRGGTVIGRVSSADKAPIAREAGADHVIVDDGGDFADQVLGLTSGAGVQVAYDGSGPATFAGTVRSLARSGTLCWYGPVIGGPGPIDIMSLPRSIKIGYAVYSDHVSTPERLRAACAQLFEWIAAGTLKVRIGGEYPLADAARAHADMEARGTTGKLLLIP